MKIFKTTCLTLSIAALLAMGGSIDGYARGGTISTIEQNNSGGLTITIAVPGANHEEIKAFCDSTSQSSGLACTVHPTTGPDLDAVGILNVCVCEFQG